MTTPAIHRARRRAPIMALALVIAAAIVQGALGSRTVSAEGAGVTSMAAIAGGQGGVVAYLGSMAAPSDKVGDDITFTAAPSAGSSAKPLFANGTASTTAKIGGAACDANRATAAALNKCFVIVTVTSSTPGLVDVSMKNTTAGSPEVVRQNAVQFVPPRLISGGFYKGDTVVVQNAGSAAARVALEARNPDGTPVVGSNASVQVQPGASSNVYTLLPLAFVAADFRGVVVVGADQPVVGIVFAGRGNSIQAGVASTQFSQQSHSMSPYVANAASGSTVTLPYVANQLGDGTYNTFQTIVNAGANTACVEIEYAFVAGAGATPPGGREPVIDRGPGGGGCTTGYPIPAFGQLATTATGAQRLGFPTGTADALMAATIRSTGSPVHASVDSVVRVDGMRKDAAYEGFVVAGPEALGGIDLGTEIVVPLALKTEDGFYSQILISNPGDAVANVQIAYRDAAGTHTVPIVVPAHGTANHSVYSDEVVLVGFVGAATLTSNVPVAAVVFRAKMTTAFSNVDEAIYTAVNAVPATRAARTTFVPGVSRRLAATASHDGQNSWVSVTVPGGGAANVTITATLLSIGAGRCEEAGTRTFTKQIPGSFVFYQNGEKDSGFGTPVPACAWAGMVITSDVPILAVVGIVIDTASLPGDTDAMFNAFPRP